MRSRFRPRGVALILSGTVVGQGLVVAVSPLLTRFYRPEDFGALAVVTAIASVIGAGATAGTDRALVVAGDDRGVHALLWAGSLSITATGTVVAVAAWALRGWTSAVFVTTVLESSWWVLPVSVVAVGAHRLASAVLARREQHRAIGLRNAVQGISQTAWNLLASAAGPVGLVGGLAAGRLVAVVGVGLRRPTPFSRVAVGHAVRHHRRFFLLTPWSAATNVLGQQAPALVFAALHGATAAGLVALTMRVLGAPVGMLADAVAQYAAGAFGRVRRSGGPMAPLVGRLVSRLAIAGAVGVLVAVVVGPGAFGSVFGAEWAVSGEYARILVPAFAAQVAVSPVTQVLAMVGQQAAQLAWDVGRLVLTTGAVLVPSALGASVPVVLAALAVAMVVAYGAMLAMVVAVVRWAPAAAARVPTAEES
ncbi:lipopolysaccharide biosynthesis protein [Curtobacterium sp. P97]|uniref:lipopolysaccharide biosynthesis protein n=1 Tax=unclassified Curtobacterium TaxID=257496 RepID=UPI0034D6E2C4